VDEHQQSLLPAFSFRHTDPIEARCRRISPAVNVRV
jgi:hypothetical protein